MKKSDSNPEPSSRPTRKAREWPVKNIKCHKCDTVMEGDSKAYCLAEKCDRHTVRHCYQNSGGCEPEKKKEDTVLPGPEMVDDNDGL